MVEAWIVHILWLPFSLTGVHIVFNWTAFAFVFVFVFALDMYLVEVWSVHIVWRPLSLTGVYIVFDWTAGKLRPIVRHCSHLYIVVNIVRHCTLYIVTHCTLLEIL